MESPSLPTGLDGTPESGAVGTVNPDRAADDVDSAEPVDTGRGSTVGPAPAQPTSTAQAQPAAASQPARRHTQRSTLHGSLIPSKTVSPARTVAVKPALTVDTTARSIVIMPVRPPGRPCAP